MHGRATCNLQHIIWFHICYHQHHQQDQSPQPPPPTNEQTNEKPIGSHWFACWLVVHNHTIPQPPQLWWLWYGLVLLVMLMVAYVEPYCVLEITGCTTMQIHLLAYILYNISGS
jgi:hypothetical protein